MSLAISYYSPFLGYPQHSSPARLLFLNDARNATQIPAIEPLLTVFEVVVSQRTLSHHITCIPSVLIPKVNSKEDSTAADQLWIFSWTRRL